MLSHPYCLTFKSQKRAINQWILLRKKLFVMISASVSKICIVTFLVISNEGKRQQQKKELLSQSQLFMITSTFFNIFVPLIAFIFPTY